MKSLIDRYTFDFPRNAEPGPGGGAGAPAAIPPAGGAPNAGAGDPAPAAGGTPKAGDPPAPAATYRPDGLPETLYGNSDKETIDKLAEAWKGYRNRDADRQVPEDPKAYLAFDMDKIDEPLRPHVAELANDPVYARVTAKAKELGIPVPALQTLALEMFGGYQAEGLLEVVDEKAERAALLPDAAKDLPKAEQDKAIDARINANIAFLNLMVKNATGPDGKPVQGGLTQDVADYAQAMLGDSAKGNQFLEWASRQLTGQDKPQPFTGQATAAGGGDIRAQLTAKLAQPEMQPGHHLYNRAAREALEEEFRRAFPG